MIILNVRNEDRAAVELADLAQRFLRSETFARVKGRPEKRHAMAVVVGVNGRPAPLLKETAHPKVAGIGETGLDYYYDNSPREMQQESFRRHIRAALELGLPLIVHTRDAEDETMRILREAGTSSVALSIDSRSGVNHCP